MNHTEKVRSIHGIAMALAPSLQRYDFSVDKQFEDWADVSIKAATAFYNKIEPMLTEANAKDAAEFKVKQDAAIEEAKKQAALAEQSKEAGTP